MGPPSAASAVPNADLGSTGVVAPLRVTGMYDELGGRMLRGIRLTQAITRTHIPSRLPGGLKSCFLNRRILSSQQPTQMTTRSEASS